MDKHITAPISDEDAKELRAGDYVYITGTIYTARDAAHKRMAEALATGEPLPIDMKNNIIYYMGPSPAREGRPIGSAGTTKATATTTTTKKTTTGTTKPSNTTTSARTTNDTCSVSASI